jgi:hypothetical protein
MASSLFSCLRTGAIAALALYSPRVLADEITAVAGATVSSTILVIARDQLSAKNGATLGLQGYGIPFEVLTVPQAGIANLPVLNSSATHGNYGGIVLLSEVGYNYDNQYYSALKRAQFNTLFDYQSQFGVRMVRLDVFPASEFGVVSNGGSVSDEPVSFTNVTGFQTAGLKMYVRTFFHKLPRKPLGTHNTLYTFIASNFHICRVGLTDLAGTRT